MRFSRINVKDAGEVAEFILWLCGVTEPGALTSYSEDFADPQGLLETLWSWQGAPRKRMAKLSWQLLVKKHSAEYFDQHFTFDRYWLERQVGDCARILSPNPKEAAMGIGRVSRKTTKRPLHWPRHLGRRMVSPA